VAPAQARQLAELDFHPIINTQVANLQQARIKAFDQLCNFSCFSLQWEVLSYTAGACSAIGGAWHRGLGGCNL
jgi:hypothetical protein